MTNLNLKLKLIYKMFNINIAEQISEICSIDHGNCENIAAYKNNKIKNIVKYAINNIPFYMEHIDKSQIDINTLSVSALLDKMPLLDKATINKNANKFINSDLKGAWRSTSGTTGTPFCFFKDKSALGYMDAVMYYVYDWHGIAPSARQARIWGRSVSLTKSLVQRIKDRILGRVRLSAFHMDDEECYNYFKQLEVFRPKYFYSYSNALYQFALSLERQGVDGRLLNIPVAVCTGEVLFSHQREKIHEIFGCKVVNEYGSTENGIIGFECEFGKMHVMPTVYIDIHNKDENGYGEIIITELNSRSIPFIKYKNGDIGRLLYERCNCGRQYEVIDIKEGRIDDYIICPDGKIVYDAILAYTLKDYCIKFRGIQKTINIIHIYIVPNTKYNKKSNSIITTSLLKYLNDDMFIEIFVVDDIPLDKSGKLRYFVSEIKRV